MQVMRDAHVVEDRLDDAHAVARQFLRRLFGIVLQQPDHHADRLLVLHRDAADGVDRVEEAGVLDQDQRALVAIGEPGGDADALVFLADADEAQVLVLGDRRQQPGAGDDVGHRKDIFDRRSP